MKNVIEATEADLVISGNKVLSGINLNVKRGEAIAVTGHNGSGKSSLIKLLAGIYEPERGAVRRDFISFAYVPEYFPENIRFTVGEYLKLMAAMSNAADLLAVGNYIEQFQLSAFLKTPLRKCSKGTRQKVGFIQALVKNAEMLFLDEPFTGMDEHSRKLAMQMLLEEKGGKTLIFSLHEEDMVNELGERKVELKEGKILDFAANPYFGTKRIVLISEYPLSKAIIRQAESMTRKEASIYELTVEDEHSDKLLLELLQTGCHIVSVRKEAGE